ncbi:MAG: folate-binding protein YgfZ [Pseudohongiellaceae bacterium]
MKALRLQKKDFVQVAGPDCKTFLQGQVSCNMELLSPSQSLTGVLCNLKGRVIADFRAIEVNGGVWLQTENGMGQPLIDVLSKYAVFSKVEISLLTGAGFTAGVFGESAGQGLATLTPIPEDAVPSQQNQAWLNEDFAVVRLPVGSNSGERFEVIALKDTGESLIEELVIQAEPATKAQWLRLDIEAGVIHVQPQESEQYTPQLLNYDVSGVIDFKKGCYTGQEIVARMFYRSTAKKRLALLEGNVHISATHKLSYSEKGKQHSAEILRYDNGTEKQSSAVALSIVGTEALASELAPQLILEMDDGSTQAVNNEDSSLKFLTLPYTK